MGKALLSRAIVLRMSFRDEGDAAHARADALQRELDRAELNLAASDKDSEVLRQQLRHAQKDAAKYRKLKAKASKDPNKRNRAIVVVAAVMLFIAGVVVFTLAGKSQTSAGAARNDTGASVADAGAVPSTSKKNNVTERQTHHTHRSCKIVSCTVNAHRNSCSCSGHLRHRHLGVPNNHQTVALSRVLVEDAMKGVASSLLACSANKQPTPKRRRTHLNPEPILEIWATFDITAKGDVESLGFGTVKPRAAVAACVKKIVLRQKFPASKLGGTVHYAIEYLPKRPKFFKLDRLRPFWPQCSRYKTTSKAVWVTLTFDITPFGAVGDLRVSAKGKLGACVRKLAERTKFGESLRGRNVTLKVRVP